MPITSILFPSLALLEMDLLHLPFDTDTFVFKKKKKKFSATGIINYYIVILLCDLFLRLCWFWFFDGMFPEFRFGWSIFKPDCPSPPHLFSNERQTKEEKVSWKKRKCNRKFRLATWGVDSRCREVDDVFIRLYLAKAIYRVNSFYFFFVSILFRLINCGWQIGGGGWVASRNLHFSNSFFEIGLDCVSLAFVEKGKTIFLNPIKRCLMVAITIYVSFFLLN